MDYKKLSANLLKLTQNVEEIEKAIVFEFIEKMGIDYSSSPFFIIYFDKIDEDLCLKISSIFNGKGISYDIYSLVELFELLIPTDESKTNGIVYTPTEIKEFILNSVISDTTPPTVCDPACGCGSFLLSAAEIINRKYNISFNEILSKYIYGVDIIAHNISKCIVLFHLLALSKNELLDNKFNLVIGNSLEIDWEKSFPLLKTSLFDCVIGNPPYVRSKNISDTTRESMKKWKTSSSGNVDLYIPFYELGYNLILNTGKLGFISPNTFLQSVNGRRLRSFIKSTESNVAILDFRETQVFKHVTSYTCIVLIDKSKKNKEIKYALLNGKRSLYDYSFTTYNSEQFDNHSPWRMGEKSSDEVIKKIECIGNKLDDYKIRNGLATLKNDIFFFTPISEDEQFYYRSYGGKKYKIEKNICIDVAKPNVIKSESELNDKMEKALFPYKRNTNSVSIVDESELIKTYPNAYKFLLSVKEILLRRDKGNGKYATWYAYGRTQGMSNFGKKLLIPYISGSPVAVLSFNPDVLFYCGYAVFSESEDELRVLKKILESDVFWYYISKTSKPYSKGYMSFAKNYIKNFGIPVLSVDQKKKLLNISSKSEINQYIKLLYGVEI